MSKKVQKSEVDWRLQATGTLAKPWVSPWTGQEFAVGARITTTSILKYSGKKTLSIPVPNAVAMCLNISSSSHALAKELIANSGIQKSLKKTLRFKNDQQAIDCMENIVMSVVFAHTALEAFAKEPLKNCRFE